MGLITYYLMRNIQNNKIVKVKNQKKIKINNYSLRKSKRGMQFFLTVMMKTIVIKVALSEYLIH
jgi:hypothetical protein